MKLGVVMPYWLDRPLLEAVEIAEHADRLGYGSLWVGEMMTFDAFIPTVCCIAPEIPTAM